MFLHTLWALGFGFTHTLLTSLAISAPMSGHLSAACNAPTASLERCCVSGIPNCTHFRQPVKSAASHGTSALRLDRKPSVGVGGRLAHQGEALAVMRLCIVRRELCREPGVHVGLHEGLARLDRLYTLWLFFAYFQIALHSDRQRVSGQLVSRVRTLLHATDAHTRT